MISENGKNLLNISVNKALRENKLKPVIESKH